MECLDKNAISIAFYRPEFHNFQTLAWQYLTGTVGTMDTSIQNWSDYAYCHWFLYTDAVNRIVIEVLEVGDYCTDGCAYGNTEVRVWENGDWGKTGVRYVTLQF